jgi:hypothetical protein
VYYTGHKSKSAYVLRSPYADGLNALLPPFRGHVDAKEDAESAALDTMHLEQIKRRSDEEWNRSNLAYVDSLPDFDYYAPFNNSRLSS